MHATPENSTQFGILNIKEILVLKFSLNNVWCTFVLSCSCHQRKLVKDCLLVFKIEV